MRMSVVLWTVALAPAISATAGSLERSTLPEVVVKGSGDHVLLMIPCMSCRWETWDGFMEANADRYTMVAVTLPGFGGTPVPDLPLYGDSTPWRDNAVAALSALLDQNELENVTVVGHSFGSMVAVQLAAARPDAITRVISVDGKIQSTTWAPSNRVERLAAARAIDEEWTTNLDEADEWQEFNQVGLPSGECVDRTRALEAIRRHGSFMATPRDVLLQYWRENMLIDLTSSLLSLEIPVLDIRALGARPEPERLRHIEDLRRAGVRDNVETVFMYSTGHFVMVHRPEALSDLVASFIDGRDLEDYHPPEAKDSP